MSDKKIGNIEAIALIVTIMVNHIILNLPKSIIRSTSSGAILNVLFISLVALRNCLLNQLFIKKLSTV